MVLKTYCNSHNLSIQILFLATVLHRSYSSYTIRVMNKLNTMGRRQSLKQRATQQDVRHFRRTCDIRGAGRIMGTRIDSDL